MKFIKLFESWHQDYSYDFLDRGFDLDETSYANKTLKGTYKGKYVLTELNDDFADMITRLSYNYQILKVKTYFNETTGSASFEIEVSDKIDTDNYIEFEANDEKYKYFPVKVSFISLGNERFYGNDPSIRLSGKLESGATRELYIIKSSNNKLKFMVQGFSSKNPKIDKKNLLKLFNMIDEGHVENDYVDIYDDIKKIIIE